MESQTAYEQLANRDAELLIWLKERMAEGVTAATVEKWAPLRYTNRETVALVTGAAHYIERAGKVE